jgi:hypothetical protein
MKSEVCYQASDFLPPASFFILHISFRLAGIIFRSMHDGFIA